ncbi:hypothetical protein [Burkholderia sp. RF4-BP95]|uniref:hypothetical protein n=1 Tax=Burkholderia sp. RF4-BP95 TaxID=1637845 RepID=UPI0012E3B527|nr:hypothetical protein [Burkholderia sp. RF4-BP95]
MQLHVQRGATDDCTVEIVPDRSAYISLMIFVGGWLFLIAAFCVIFVGGWQAYKFMMLSIAIEFVLFVYIRRNSIALGNNAIVVRTMFSVRRISISELTDVRLEVGVKKYVDRFKPMFRLVFVSGCGDVVLNAKLYSHNDLNAVIRFVENRI